MPQMFGNQGICWCPTCGAVRDIKRTVENQFTYVGRWIYPTGYEDVLKQIERSGKQS